MNNAVPTTTSPPPHAIKQDWVTRLQSLHDTATLIETGTYYGDMIVAQMARFRTIYSIELHPSLCIRAGALFAEYSHIHILEGDSANVLPRLLERIRERCLFWLDGHYSGGRTARAEKDTPIVEELAAIKAHIRSDHVILIDDARLFDGTSGYPTIPFVHQQLLAMNPRYAITVADDIIQACPPGRTPGVNL